MKTLPCIKCKKPPLVLPAGNCMCSSCKISATTREAWNRFMKTEDIGVLIEKLERPASVLKAIHLFTTDTALRALAESTLASLDDLNFSEYFSDQKEAAKYETEIRERLKNVK